MERTTVTGPEGKEIEKVVIVERKNNIGLEPGFAPLLVKEDGSYNAAEHRARGAYPRSTFWTGQRLARWWERLASAKWHGRAARTVCDAYTGAPVV